MIFPSLHLVAVGSGGTGVTAIPAFSVHRNQSHQTGIVSGVETKIQFTTEEYDTNNNFDSATNYRFTPTVAGKYLITAVAAMGGLAAGAAVEAIIYRNGTLYKYGSFAACGSTGFSLSFVSHVVPFNGSTDYVEFYVYHDHGSDRDLFGSPDGTFASGAWVAP